MFGGRFSSHIGLLGIDIGSRSIKLLQLQQVDDALDSLEVVGAGEVEQDHPHDPAAHPDQITSRDTRNSAIGTQQSEQERQSAIDNRQSESASQENPNAAAIAGRLRAAFASGRFTGRRCVVSLPREDVHVQSVRLPKMPDAELRQAVGWEAAQRFGMSHDRLQVDFIRTGATLQSGENKEEVIIVAASHEAIERRLTPLIDAGFRPVAIDTGFAALARIFSRQFRREADRQNVRAIVELGVTGSTVLILRGDQIAFCKPLEISGQQFNQTVAEHLDMDVQSASELRMAAMFASSRGESASESSQDPSTERAVYEAVRPVINDLVREVNMCLRYFGVTFRGKPPTQITLTGGDSLEPRLAEHLERGCKIAVTHDDHANTLTGLVDGIQRICHPGLGGSPYFRRSISPGCWAVAAGLSLRGIAVKEESFLGRLWRASGSTGHHAPTPAMKGVA